ncbi:putative Integral membrane protein [Seiridium cardinale]
MDDVNQSLPMSMTMAAFAGISWYIGIEINISLFLLFKRRRGLYFWSCALSSWGVVLQPLFIILADFGVWKDLIPSITMIYLTCLIMVVPQGWVLYSRLHLLMHKAEILRGIKFVLIFNSIVFSGPTMVIGVLAQTTTFNPSLISVNRVWDRLQLVVFLAQETTLGILYIYQTHKYLRDCSPLIERSVPSTVQEGLRCQTKEQKSVLNHLVYTNLLVIALDVTLLGIQCANFFYLQGAFKPCVYGIKLKVEFVILNRLVNSVQRRANGELRVTSGYEIRTASCAVSRGDTADRRTRYNGFWHKPSEVISGRGRDGIQLEHTKGGHAFGSQSRESQHAMLG